MSQRESVHAAQTPGLAWWPAALPGPALGLAALGINLVGGAFCDMLDARFRV